MAAWGVDVFLVCPLGLRKTSAPCQAASLEGRGLLQNLPEGRGWRGLSGTPVAVPSGQAGSSQGVRVWGPPARPSWF